MRTYVTACLKAHSSRKTRVKLFRTSEELKKQSKQIVSLYYFLFSDNFSMNLYIQYLLSPSAPTRKSPRPIRSIQCEASFTLILFHVIYDPPPHPPIQLSRAKNPLIPRAVEPITIHFLPFVATRRFIGYTIAECVV